MGRRSWARWKELEKKLVTAFNSEWRALGGVVRRRLFERTAKRFFRELYPDSPVEFRFSLGWFGRFLSHNEITLRIVTNKAQETPQECRDMIANF